MSFGKAYKLDKLAFREPEIESEQASSVSVESLMLPDEQVSVVKPKRKRQTGGVISAKNFSSR